MLVCAIGSRYCIDYIYLNHNVLTTPLACESETKYIVVNNGDIDSIVTHSSIELNTESPFTFVYLHSGKCIKKVGECIYHSSKSNSALLCILEPPCCDGNVYVYHWFKYYQQRDTLEQVSLVWVYVTTKINNKNIIWHACPKQKKIPNLLLRSEPIVNDIEEDFVLRQFSNVIYEGSSELVSIYELGFNKENPCWRICAIRHAKDNYLLGWCSVYP